MHSQTVLDHGIGLRLVSQRTINPCRSLWAMSAFREMMLHRLEFVHSSNTHEKGLLVRQMSLTTPASACNNNGMRYKRQAHIRPSAPLKPDESAMAFPLQQPRAVPHVAAWM